MTVRSFDIWPNKPGQRSNAAPARPGVIYDGGRRTDAAKLGGVTLQIIRDWVIRFNANGPESLKNRWSSGPVPKLTLEHRKALAEWVGRGPIPAIHGVVRWRCCDLVQGLCEEFGISADDSTVGRTLRDMGYRRITARPRHHAQNEYVVDDFKKLRGRVGKDPGAPWAERKDRAVVAR